MWSSNVWRKLSGERVLRHAGAGDHVQAEPPIAGVAASGLHEGLAGAD